MKSLATRFPIQLINLIGEKELYHEIKSINIKNNQCGLNITQEAL